jgi:gamma-aminobutyric acid type B receptor
MVWQCSVDHVSDIVNIVLFAYLGFLQFIGVILALRTRKVKIKVLNDAKYIITLVYISSIVLILIAIIRFTVVSMIHVTEVFYSGGLLVATTAFLALTFIPKMISLYRDPQGVEIFSKNAASVIEVSRAGALSIRNKPDKMTELEERIKELETRLKEKVLV